MTPLRCDTCVSTNIEVMPSVGGGRYLVTEPLPKICKAMDSIHSTAPQHTLNKRKGELFFSPSDHLLYFNVPLFPCAFIVFYHMVTCIVYLLC